MPVPICHKQVYSLANAKRDGFSTVLNNSERVMPTFVNPALLTFAV